MNASITTQAFAKASQRWGLPRNSGKYEDYEVDYLEKLEGKISHLSEMSR